MPDRKQFVHFGNELCLAGGSGLFSTAFSVFCKMFVEEKQQQHLERFFSFQSVLRIKKRFIVEIVNYLCISFNDHFVVWSAEFNRIVLSSRIIQLRFLIEHLISKL